MSTHTASEMPTHAHQREAGREDGGRGGREEGRKEGRHRGGGEQRQGQAIREKEGGVIEGREEEAGERREEGGVNSPSYGEIVDAACVVRYGCLHGCLKLRTSWNLF